MIKEIMLETILIVFVCVICSILLFVLLRSKNKINIRTPVVLAKQILRHPERILIDIPSYAAASDSSINYDFLIETESVLASIGELKTRRTFVVLVAEVVKSPATDSIERLIDFMFHVSQQVFLNTLRWDGKCDNAIHFLGFVDYLLDALKKGKKIKDIQRAFKKKRKHSPKNVLTELNGADAEIMQEWFEIHNALYKDVISWQTHSNGVAKEMGKIQHSDSISLIKENRAPHLSSFLIAAWEVCKSLDIVAADTMPTKM